MLQAIATLYTFEMAISWASVAPKTWQKPLKEGKERWTKERSLALAVEFYGDKEIFVKPKRTADGFADACHIASWGMKQT